MTGGHAAYIWPKTIPIFMTFLNRFRFTIVYIMF